MTRYCAQCGSSLNATELRAGHCSICGTAIEAANIGFDPSDVAPADSPTQATPGVYAAASGLGGAPNSPVSGAHTIPAQPQAQPQPQPQRRIRRPRRVSSRWALLLLSAVILLLTGAAIYALAQRTPLSIVLAPFTSSNANASSNSSSSSGSAAATASSASRGPATSHSPTPTSPPGSPPQPTATHIPTATPVPPTLSVSPKVIKLIACLNLKMTQFTVSNTGGEVLSWSASANVSSYQISPSNGSIDPGLQETVTVSNIFQSGVVTVNAPGALNSPQQVTITCTV